MRKLLLITCLFLGLVWELPGQPPQTDEDTLWVSTTEVRTFVIRKEEEIQPPLAMKEEMNSRSIEPKKDSTLTLVNDPRLMPPSLASDEMGLSNMFYLEPYNERAQLPASMKFVVFSFSIDEYGYVSDFRVFDTNDRRLVDVLVRKLDKTRWNPAQSIEGERKAFDFKKWIAIVPAETKEEDYERHRY